jgi:hypothetical protein
MIKHLFAIIIFIIGIAVCAQEKEPNSFLIKGSCVSVLNHLRAELQNDSLAIVYFKDHYFIIDNAKARRVVKQDTYKNIIHFFSMPENSQIRCCKAGMLDKY